MIEITSFWSWGKGQTKKYKSIKLASQFKRRNKLAKFECTYKGEEFTLIGQKIITKSELENILKNWNEFKY